MNSYNSLSTPPKGRLRQVLLATISGEFYIGMWYEDHFELLNCPILRSASERISTGEFIAWMELEGNTKKFREELPEGFIPSCKHPDHNNEIILKIGFSDYCIGRWNEEEGKFIGNWFPKSYALWSRVEGWMEIPPVPL